MGSMLQEGLGPHAMWGFTPAMDLLSQLPANTEAASILLLQPGDPGHILKTVSSRRRHPGVRKLDIYLWDTPPEVLARHLLLLQVAHDWEVPIRQRAAVFLEIFGNSALQVRAGNPGSANYMVI
jgi:dynein assembly factor 3, axonemal